MISGQLCPICFQPVAQPRRGYRLMHKDCKDLSDVLGRLRSHVERLADGTHSIQLPARGQLVLRFELFCLTSMVPRPRDPRTGRYFSSKLSGEYDQDAKKRRARRTPKSVAAALSAMGAENG
jgi:hypothetical protein